MRRAGQVDFGAGFFHQADHLVAQRRVAAQPVGVYGVQHVECAVLHVPAQLAVGVDLGLGVLPENDVAALARHAVDAHDVAAHVGGELAAQAFLLFEADFVFGGLLFAADGAPDGDAGRAVVFGHGHLSRPNWY